MWDRDRPFVGALFSAGLIDADGNASEALKQEAANMIDETYTYFW